MTQDRGSNQGRDTDSDSRLMTERPVLGLPMRLEVVDSACHAVPCPIGHCRRGAGWGTGSRREGGRNCGAEFTTRETRAFASDILVIHSSTSQNVLLRSALPNEHLRDLKGSKSGPVGPIVSARSGVQKYVPSISRIAEFL